MAARQITMDDNEPIDVDVDDVSDAVDDAAQIEADIWASMGGSESAEYTIKLYRVPQNGGTYPWLFDTAGTSQEGILERLGEEYGSGQYEARVFRRVNGKNTLRKRIKLAIERAKPNAIIQQPTAQDSALLQTVTKQGELLNMLFAKFSNISAPPPAPPPPPAPSMLEMFTAMGAAMKMFRDLTPAPAPVVASADPFKMLASAMSLAKEMQNDGREKGMIDLVGDFLQSPLVGQLTAQMGGQAPPQPQQPQRGLPPPQAPGAPQRPPQPQQSTQNLVPSGQQQNSGASNPGTDDFAVILADLVSRAANGSDPMLYADWLADRATDEQLSGLVQTPNILDVLAQVNPGVAQHREWFGEMLEGLKDHAEQDNPSGPLLTVPPNAGQMPGAPNSDTVTPLVSGTPPIPAAVPIDGPS